tara:strand:+ start:1137 stop:1295 length:159 start_codon:yes stop_codon:yes gene_type:complete
MECVGIILETPDAVGVLAGTSEFDRMEFMWKEVGSAKESNWAGLDRLISEDL